MIKQLDEVLSEYLKHDDKIIRTYAEMFQNLFLDDKMTLDEIIEVADDLKRSITIGKNIDEIKRKLELEQFLIAVKYALKILQ